MKNSRIVYLVLKVTATKDSVRSIHGVCVCVCVGVCVCVCVCALFWIIIYMKNLDNNQIITIIFLFYLVVESAEHNFFNTTLTAF